MVINGRPRLACNTFLNRLKLKNETLILQPLSKFPTVQDLKVDRNVIFDNIKKMNLWLDGEAAVVSREEDQQYSVSRCMMCGCCLEVCPNFTNGASFAGATVMNAAYKVISQNQDSEHKRALMKAYQKYGSSGCSKSTSCESVCPMSIKATVSMSRLNKIRNTSVGR
jgi:succinate dehydrogenase / fumarate reductase iron-sulfur subunit